MKFVLARNGARGDVEPCATVGRELLRRGHDVRMAVPPNMVGFVESAGLAAVTYGPAQQGLLQDPEFVRKFSKIQNPISALPEVIERFMQVWMELGTTLTALANGADLLLTAMTEQGLAANVGDTTKFRWLRCTPFQRSFGRLRGCFSTQ
jgi:UDP:flavonoid glycosyltransferase YjiC (YdhE family)